MHPASSEQQSIVDAVRAGHNVLVDAVAGSGKTTTVLHLAKQMPDRHVLQLTYNRHLKDDVVERVHALGIDNLEVFTFHGCATRFFSKGRAIHNDTSMCKLVERGEVPAARTALAKFSVLVLDEAQDLDALLFKFAKMLRRHLPDALQIIVMGDRYQGIYEVKGADPRFLTLSAGLWGLPFVTLKLGTSYRLTRPMAAFLNGALLGEQRLDVVKDGPPIRYVISKAYDWQQSVGVLISDAIASGRYKPDDFFVLAPSVKSAMAPVKQLENWLVGRGIFCYAPNNDLGETSKDVQKDKVVFSSLHQSKGRERKVVILVGLDDSYFKFYAKHANTDSCPNPIYVGASRATWQLVVIQTQKVAPFIHGAAFDELRRKGAIEVLDMCHGRPFDAIRMKSDPPRWNVTDMIKFIRQDYMPELIDLTAKLFQQLLEPGALLLETPIQICNETMGTYEETSDIIGVAIPALLEALTRKTSTVWEYIRDHEEPRGMNRTLKKHMAIVKEREPRTVEEMLRLVTVYLARESEYVHRLEQLDRYDWLLPEDIEACHAFLGQHVGVINRYEQDIMRNTQWAQLYGRMDAVTDAAVYEFKVTNELTFEHRLQLILYAWMCQGVMPQNSFRLVNFKTGEIQELVNDVTCIARVVEILCANKLSLGQPLDDAAFVAKNRFSLSTG